MEKIKLVDGQIFELIPMGISTNEYDKKISFSFVSDSGYAEIESAFITENISKIEYLSSSSEVLKTYTNCISLKSLSKEYARQVEDKVVADVYSVELLLNNG